MSVANIQNQAPPPPPPIQAISGNQEQKSGNNNHTPSSSSLSSTCYEQLCIDESIVQKEIYNFLEIITPYDNNDANAAEEEKVLNLVIYSHLNPILQIGPVCGIVALAMAGQINKISTTTTNSDTILQEAIKLGCTNKGEMFSALAMVQLANTVFSSHEAILMNNRGLNSNDVVKRILTTISDGSTILVPYDADFNHSPSLRRGHGAHWAILHGILVTDIIHFNTQTNNEEEDKVQQENLSELYISLKKECYLNQSEDEQQQQPEPKLEQEKNNSKNTVILRPENITIETKNKLITLFELKHTKCKVFAICHQGKSKHTGIWDLLDLIKSNENLIQASPKINENQEIDPLILFDMAEFLSHKMVILQRKS